MKREEILKTAKPILFNTEMVKAILNGRKTVTRRLIKAKKFDVNSYCFEYMETDPDEIRIDRCGNEYLYPLKGLYANFSDGGHFPMVKAPYNIGDYLYVRETWFYEEHMHDVTAGKPDLPSERYSFRYIYKASESDYPVDVGVGANGWRPSIHMPKEAARIFLRVTDVRVEHLQDMTEENAYEEGFEGVPWCYHESFEDYPNSPLPCYAVSTERANCPSDPPCNHSVPESFGSDVWDKMIKKSDFGKYGWNANPYVWRISFERVEVE